MTTTLKKIMLTLLFDKTSPKKYSLLLFKYSSSKIVTDVPTVDKDWGFLFGAITTTGISFV